MLRGEEAVTVRVSEAALHHVKNLSEAVTMMSVLCSDEWHNRGTKRKWRMLPGTARAVGGSPPGSASAVVLYWRGGTAQKRSVP